MEEKPVVSRITIYPVKSLDGISLQKAIVTEGGCLLHDREYAIFDSNGKFVNGKSNPLCHSLRLAIDFENEVISLRHGEENTWHQFHLQNERLAIDSYLTNFFGFSCKLLQNKQGRFLDIPDIGGLTVVSTATFQSVSRWFNNMELEETRGRFRATIEIEGVSAFWEDHLFFKKETGIEFTIGEVTVIGVEPRERCVVPTRNPISGEVTHAFPKTFAKNRAASLPVWSTLNDYGHSYYLTVDCYIPASEIGKWIYIGDEIKIVGKKVLPGNFIS